MAPVLPSSLSPHICVLPSPDLEELLQYSALPPLSEILQSFSPLPQVRTRTTTLTPVPHESFALRFSDLAEIEAACSEDEEQRAARTIDWIGERINKRCAKWVEDMEKISASAAKTDTGGDADSEAHLESEEVDLRTPWWDELKHCAEGDHVPSRIEGWNHPVSIILAASTTAPNPLQAITALHSRLLDFPAWVDTTYILFTLIIHPQNSALSTEEAGALFNAVKKQYGLHCYLLQLALPSPPPTSVPVPILLPRLPPPPASMSENGTSTPQNGVSSASKADLNLANTTSSGVLNMLSMVEQDIQAVAKFTREFVVMSLIPFMERCVMEWNEAYSSSRRLPSRLFSSTRRLFGASNTIAPPVPASSSASSTLSRSHAYAGSTGSAPGSTIMPSPPSQQRRLAEFATILGDFKLAISVWESLRKEGKGGSEILPMLLSPSPAVQLHVSHALSMILSPAATEVPAQAQLRALLYAVRWDISIPISDLLSSTLEGDRWLVWAAGSAEEPPSALLLARAALLSLRRKSRRRAALWYLVAANRLEKCGIKPLTMYFLRCAHALFKQRPKTSLSPSFWDSEGKQPSEDHGFDAVMSSIEHPLGRLLYTTGDVAGAVRLFLGLLKSSSSGAQPSLLALNGNADGSEDAAVPTSDKVFLEDFRVAFKHFQSISGDTSLVSDLKLPFQLVILTQTRVRLARDAAQGDEAEWEKREEVWSSFWRSTGGKERLGKSGKVAVGELFSVEVALYNPLDTEISLSKFTVRVKETQADQSSSSGEERIHVEVIDGIVLGAKESRIVPVSIRPLCPAQLTVTHVSYDFLDLLPSLESLGSRGRRLHDTSQQRLTPTYAPDVFPRVEVAEAGHKLAVRFLDENSQMVLAQGEVKELRLRLENLGTNVIGEVWMVAGAKDQIWVGGHKEASQSEHCSTSSHLETIRSDNKLLPWRPYRWGSEEAREPFVLNPGASREWCIVMHASQEGTQDLSLLFVYRECEGQPFHSTRVMQHYDVVPVLNISTNSQPSRNLDHMFLLNLAIENVLSSTPVQLVQITTISPTWSCAFLQQLESDLLQTNQTTQLSFGASSLNGGSNAELSLSFVSQKLNEILQGRSVEPTDPPAIDLIYSHALKTKSAHVVNDAATRHFIHSSRINHVTLTTAARHPHIPSSSHPYIFPLYSPFSVDILVFWTIPSQKRSGHISVPDISLGVGDAALKKILTAAEEAKATRSMYAETRREKKAVIAAIKSSEWHTEANPVMVVLEDAGVLEHDFRQGPTLIQIPFMLRNYSLTRVSRFILRFNPPREKSLPSHLLAPHFVGRLVFRGTVAASETTTVKPKLWVTRPGLYSLSDWRLEVEVGEPHADNSTTWQTSHHYVQDPPWDELSMITISDINITG